MSCVVDLMSTSESFGIDKRERGWGSLFPHSLLRGIGRWLIYLSICAGRCRICLGGLLAVSQLLQHDFELLEVDLAVTVDVHLSDNVLPYSLLL